jgi:cytidylate kinase
LNRKETRNSIVTIDGPAGAGKSTVSRLLARKLGFLYLDTGAMYRAVALIANRIGIDFEDVHALQGLCSNLPLRFSGAGDQRKIYVGDEDISLKIRTSEMDMLSSRVSAVKEVRESMAILQREIGRDGNLVAEGRDMGTVVFPDANHKFFVTATPETRAARRYQERLNRGEAVSRAEVALELAKRDEQDMMRTFSPLRPAKDAQLIDSTNLTPEQVVEEILLAMKNKNFQGLCY